ncbi:MAG: hypothetical protein QF440_04215 [Candidatus Thalassarchaeaceae archaeon]|nr:hypothetical protein [Candidatus Thalassarchaeaceae archaeon]
MQPALTPPSDEPSTTEVLASEVDKTPHPIPPHSSQFGELPLILPPVRAIPHEVDEESEELVEQPTDDDDDDDDETIWPMDSNIQEFVIHQAKDGNKTKSILFGDHQITSVTAIRTIEGDDLKIHFSIERDAVIGFQHDDYSWPNPLFATTLILAVFSFIAFIVTYTSPLSIIIGIILFLGALIGLTATYPAMHRIRLFSNCGKHEIWFQEGSANPHVMHTTLAHIDGALLSLISTGGLDLSTVDFDSPPPVVTPQIMVNSQPPSQVTYNTTQNIQDSVIQGDTGTTTIETNTSPQVPIEDIPAPPNFSENPVITPPEPAPVAPPEPAPVAPPMPAPAAPPMPAPAAPPMPAPAMPAPAAPPMPAPAMPAPAAPAMPAPAFSPNPLDTDFFAAPKESPIVPTAAAPRSDSLSELEKEDILSDLED